MDRKGYVPREGGTGARNPGIAHAMQLVETAFTLFCCRGQGSHGETSLSLKEDKLLC